MNRYTPGTRTYSASEPAPDGDGRVMRVVSKGCVYEIRFDEEDLEIVQSRTWSIAHRSTTRYAVSAERSDDENPGHLLLLHRLVVAAPEHMAVDHANRNGLDNRKVNLRVCSISENAFNSSMRAGNASGYKGVCQTYPGSGRYMARLKCRGVEHHCGTYGTPEEAARAYDRAAIELHGEFARTNFPREDYR